jgi:homoserine kinase type II
MEQYTRLNAAEIKTILAQFDIHNVSSCELLSGGSENTNYLVKSKKGKHVLCIFEQKTAKNATELARILKHLTSNNFNTSTLVDTIENKSVLVWEGKPIIIKAFIEGNIRKDLSPDLLGSIGKELAKLHQINAPEYLPKQLAYGQEHFDKVKQYAPNSEFDSWLQTIQVYISPYLNLNLPKSFIHSDIFWDNIIIDLDGKTVTIIDFEESTHYYRIFDLGMTIIGVCGEAERINLDKVKPLLEGYLSGFQLLEDELNALKAFTIYAGAAMAFWRHRNFNYVKPDPKMFNHYMGLKVLVDDLIKQPDDCFLKLLDKHN